MTPHMPPQRHGLGVAVHAGRMYLISLAGRLAARAWRRTLYALTLADDFPPSGFPGRLDDSVSH